MNQHVSGLGAAQETPRPKDMPGLFTLLRRYFWIILACGLLCAGLTLAASSVIPTKYKATAQLYVDPRDLQVLDKQVTPQTEAQNIGTTLVETQAVILGSDLLLKRVIDKLGLVGDPEFNGTARRPIDDLLDRARTYAPGLFPEPKVYDDSAAIVLDKLRRAVNVYRLDRSYVIQASVTAQDRDKARKILDTLVTAFLSDQTTSRADLASRTSSELNSGIDALKQDVESLEQTIARYKEENGLVGARGQMVSEQQLSDLNTQLVNARVEVERLKARLDATPRAARDLDKVPEAVASPTLRDLRGQMARISQRRAVLASQLLPGHPDMRAISDSEQQAMREVGAELGRIRSAISIDYARARGNEAALTTKLDELRGRLNEANQAQIKLRELERKRDAARAVYAQAITRSKEANEQARLNTANVRVISEAFAPQERIFPPPAALLGAIGFILGLLCMIMLIHLRNLARAGKAA